MKTSRILAAMCLLLSIAGLGVADEPPAGFVALFNGKDLAGWVQMNGSKFCAENGAIKHRQGMGWLRTTEQYDNFRLPRPARRERRARVSQALPQAALASQTAVPGTRPAERHRAG
jgi:hypothetical protein